MNATTTAPHADAPEPVLSTLNKDGTRRWLQPRPSPGRFWKRRRALAYGLILLFVALPHVFVGGKPAILLDLARREFTFFGTTLLATDTLFLMLFLVSLFVAVFLLTALLGRVWCGWGCPQTVYMEFVFRPLERWLDGPRGVRSTAGRTVVKYALFLLIAVGLAHVFLSYFVGVDALARWVRRSPFEHPASFLVMLGTTALVFADFAWFREQTCLVACPYGRFQSVLLDRRSLIVGYDRARGEPRGKPIKPGGGVAALDTALVSRGDCVDCSACVATCPTGIDIREGLQMECIHCTQCMDACDAIMTRLDRTPGLIRYTSQDELQGKPRRFLRVRTVIYPALLVAAVTALVLVALNRKPMDVTVLRDRGAPFTVLSTGQVSNALRIKLVNRTAGQRQYTAVLTNTDGQPLEGVELVTPDLPATLVAGQSTTLHAFVLMPRAALEGGVRPVRVRVQDDAGNQVEAATKLLGPTGAGGGSLP